MLKEQIILTALNLFNSKGVRFTVDELAKTLKISKKTLYKLYESKKLIIEDIIQKMFESIVEQEEEIIQNKSMDIIIKIKEVVCLFPSHLINYDYVKELKTTYPSIFMKIEEAIENNWDNTFKLIKLAIIQGRLREMNIDNIKLILTGLFKEILFIDKSVQKQMLRECIDLIFEGYVV